MTSPELISKVSSFCRREGFLPAGSRGVVAFSGGPDSLALLDILRLIAREHDLHVMACHVDHGLRGTSGAEAEEARRLGIGIGVEVVIERIEGLSAVEGNLEERAREARYNVLEKVAERVGATWIALGHTAEDQAETLLLRLLRGAGTRGLGAMAPQRGLFVRPLLTSRRADLEAHLDRRGLAPLRDPSNADLRFARNRVRSALIPRLIAENPRAVEVLGRAAANLREDADALDAVARERFASAWDGTSLHLAPLQGAPSALLSRILATAYEGVTGSRRRLTRAHLLALGRLCQDSAGTARVDLPGWVAERRYDRLFLLEAARAVEEPSFRSFEVHAPGEWIFPDVGRFEVIVGVAQGDEPLALPLARTPFPLLVRPPQAGDRICVARIGERHHRRVGRILIDAKVPLRERKALPLVYEGCEDGELLLIVGLRRAAGWACAQGEKVIRLAWEPS
ncbi:MAG: tRNA lysidine(34) synthetase TilS [Deltaproteobacteria bacterium]|nr:tRNA lysidine(34) synthetase TilS [Deltaproteobacteria bacterium]